jgi:hypothetical protein
MVGGELHDLWGRAALTCGTPRCSDVWCKPLHKPIGVIGHHRPGYR